MDFEPETEGDSLPWVSTLEFRSKEVTDRIADQSSLVSKVIPELTLRVRGRLAIGSEEVRQGGIIHEANMHEEKGFD